MKEARKRRVHFFQPPSPNSLIAKIEALPYYVAIQERIRDLELFGSTKSAKYMQGWKFMSPNTLPILKSPVGVEPSKAGSPTSNIYEILSTKEDIYYQGAVFHGFNLRVKNKPELSFIFYPLNRDEIIIAEKDQKKLAVLDPSLTSEADPPKPKDETKASFNESKTSVSPFTQLQVNRVAYSAACAHPFPETLPGSDGFPVTYADSKDGSPPEKIQFSRIFQIKFDDEKKPLIFYTSSDKKGYVIVASAEEKDMVSRHQKYCEDVLGFARLDVIKDLSVEFTQAEELTSISAHELKDGTHYFQKGMNLKFRNEKGEADQLVYYPSQEHEEVVAVKNPRDKVKLEQFLRLYPEHAKMFKVIDVVEKLSPSNRPSHRLTQGDQ